jgi:hypothetical protein
LIIYVINNINYVIHNRKVYKLEFSKSIMASIEEHEKTVKELIEDIEEKMRLGLVAKRQKIIGFAVSEASTNLFAVFLHKNSLITPGFNVNHSSFVSKKRAEETFNFDFENKDIILELLVQIEGLRNRLCYGREKEAKEANDAIEKLFKLKEILGGKNDKLHL